MGEKNGVEQAAGIIAFVAKMAEKGFYQMKQLTFQSRA